MSEENIIWLKTEKYFDEGEKMDLGEEKNYFWVKIQIIFLKSEEKNYF